MSHHDLRPGQVLADRYRIDRALGSGAIGTVYAAEDLLLTRPVAVKVIDPAFADDGEVAEAVRRAGSLMASVSHPGLVTVYDATQLDEHYCIVMELVPGPNLQSLIDDGGVSPQLAARIGSQAADALQKLHDLDRVHGRVTPGNVLVTPAGTAKLVDVALGPDVPEHGAAADSVTDVQDLADALRESVADPAARDAADLVDVLDAARTNTDGSTWSAGQLADALRVLASGATPGPIVAGSRDAERTAAMPTGTSRAADPGATQVLPVHDTQELEPTRPIAVEAGDEPRTVAGRPPTRDDRPARPLRPAWFGRALLVVAVLAVIVVVATRYDSGAPLDGGNGGEGAEPVAIQAASDFDPLGGGGEHGDEVPFAFDGDPATAWTTEGYEQPDLGGIKAGVGIWFDLGQPSDVRRITLTMPFEGADVAVYGLDTQPQGRDPSAWGEPVATLSGAPAHQDVQVPEGRTARYWLVWITHLGPDDGRYRAGVAEIAFAAR